MFLRSLYLKQFRRYQEAFFEFSPSLNVICGPNAKGKTTVLEAIHLLMLGRSFRPSQSVELIHEGTSSFFIEAFFNKHQVDQTLRFYFDAKERRILYNQTSLTHLSHLLGLIQGVVMTPDDVNLVKGAPQIRRQFIDVQIAQVDPLYVHHLTRYMRAMRQRNQLLKQKTTKTIESWEYELVQAAVYLMQQRRKTVDALQSFCEDFYANLTHEKETLTLHYRPSGSKSLDPEEMKAEYTQLLHKQRDREMMIGYTLSGPHKDDISIHIGGRDARQFASEGQQRSCVTALHFGEWQQLKLRADHPPLFMIDDVGISLDSTRQQRLVEQLSSLGQVFLTTTDSTLLKNYRGEKKVFHLPFSASEN
jgi:DNA replication and repair protein RecF